MKKLAYAATISVILLAGCGNSISNEETITANEEIVETEEIVAESPSQAEHPGLSSDPYDFQFELEGEIYQIPCLVSDFLDNGWELIAWHQTQDEIVDGYEAYGILPPYSVNKGNGSLWIAKPGIEECHIYVCNFTEDDLALDDCIVYKFINSSTRAHFGVNRSMSEDWYGEPARNVSFFITPELQASGENLDAEDSLSIEGLFSDGRYIANKENSSAWYDGYISYTNWNSVNMITFFRLPEDYIGYDAEWWQNFVDEHPDIYLE